LQLKSLPLCLLPSLRLAGKLFPAAGVSSVIGKQWERAPTPLAAAGLHLLPSSSPGFVASRLVGGLRDRFEGEEEAEKERKDEERLERCSSKRGSKIWCNPRHGWNTSAEKL